MFHRQRNLRKDTCFMSNRGVFLPLSGDPFVACLWLKFFKEVWQDEIDTLYVCYNSDIDKNIADFVMKKFEHPKIKFTYLNHPAGASCALDTYFDQSKEETILLIEEDGFVYKKGLLDSLFKKIESGEYDAIGSPRMSCTPGISQATLTKYNLDYSGVGDKGPNFWPNFFFVKRKDLERTDKFFGAKSWQKGEIIPGLDLKVEESETGDTFVWLSIQLRALGLKFLEVPQCHCYPLDLDDKLTNERLWLNPNYGWLHSGSLSASWNTFLAMKYVPNPIDDFFRQEIETRIAFWTTACLLEEYDEIEDFKKKYQAGMMALFYYYQLDVDRVSEKVTMYKEILKI